MEDGFSLKEATIGIVGLGLMGGSLAMSLKGKCACIIGFDAHLPALEIALSKKIIDYAESDLASFLAQLDVLILAVPVPTIISFLKQLPSFTTKPLIVTDLGSTKRDILQAMNALPENFDPIGGHPICGKENLGIENADKDLYENAPFILTPLDRTTRRARSAVRKIISTIGASCIEMAAGEHDKFIAATSHLPFLISSALAHSTPKEFSPFIGPGFRSTSRLAGTPSHMMMGILKSNRDNVLRAIQAFRNSLNDLESALENEDFNELEYLLDQSRSSYQTMVNT